MVLIIISVLIIILAKYKKVVRFVNQHAITELSAELIMRYYENEFMPFLEHFDDKSLWYGPAEGQFIKGREAMIDIWNKEEHTLTFTVGDMKAEAITSHPSFCDVMLSYPVVTHYPDGQDISVYQRLLLCWGERRFTNEDGERVKQPRILVCHISNPHAKHEEDVIYPKNFQQVYTERDIAPHRGERLHFHGVDRSDYFYLSDHILWIESSTGGLHSILHTASETTEVFDRVSDLYRKYSHLFLRCHQSYLVNPHYIRNIRRFKVTLANGVLLPIPEKKYTAFRNQAAEYLINDYN